MTAETKNPGLFIFQENKKTNALDTATTPSKPLNVSPEATTAETTQAPLNLYEYSLGLKDVQAKYVTYGEKQAYVSKPLDIPGNVMEIELEATEEHPVFDAVSGRANTRQTSIEYAISYKNKPTASDWIPLLPKNQTTVIGERLLFQGQEAALRFPAQLDESSFAVYMNGLRLPYTDILFLSNQKVSLQNFSAAAIYTVDYTPDNYRQDPWVCKLNDYKHDIQSVTQVFPAGTAFNKTLTLDHYPFVDMQRILADNAYNPNTSTYKPIQVRLIDAGIQGRNRTTLKLVEPYRDNLLSLAYTYNKTLYQDKSWSQLQSYDLTENAYYGGFDYFHWKDKLTFTEQFNVKRLQENLAYTHGNASIEVTYQTLVTHFRLKIILRRNTADEQTATPKIGDYRLRFKTMK